MKKFILAVLISISIAFAVTFVPMTAFALDAQQGVNAARGDGTPANLFDGDTSIFTQIVNILLFVIGALSVIMLIIGGLRYAISGGNTSNVTAAKNTILYAIVGLVVAFLAYAIVNWVLEAVSPGGSAGTNV